MLQNGCFINSYTAEMLRLRMLKKMVATAKNIYKSISSTIDDDYRKNTTLLVVGKLLNCEVEKTTINNIVLTNRSATYDRVSIEADNLLSVLYKKLNFNSEFDIYTITEAYADHISAELDAARHVMAKDAIKTVQAEANVNLDEHDAQLEAVEEEVPQELRELPTFKINGIDITPSVSVTCQRYLNKIRINKEEIGKAIHRASCHHDANDYKLFLKSVCKMSIKWHDIIANGMAVKMHSTITREEYQDEKPGPSAPALKFNIDKENKCINIQVDKERQVKVSLAKIVRKVDSLNRRTDNGYMRTRDWQNYFSNRTYNWCQHQLVQILVDASTFELDGVDAEGKAVKIKQVLLNKDDITKLLDIANEAKRAAVERSKEFLNTAVQLTKAEKIEFLGEQAYKVQGTMRTYAVVIKNAKVYDFETKQYRCIVNDRHYAGAGYDDIAARLLALKNDSVMQEKIGTLRGAAQPGAENVHNDYRPERDNIAEHIDAAVNRALAAV
jgi:hypothetical protein